MKAEKQQFACDDCKLVRVITWAALSKPMSRKARARCYACGCPHFHPYNDLAKAAYAGKLVPIMPKLVNHQGSVGNL